MSGDGSDEFLELDEEATRECARRLRDAIDDFIVRQHPLCCEADEILRRNLWDLYVE